MWTQPAAFATGVLGDLYAFHRYTSNSTGLCPIQDSQFWMPRRGWAPVLNIQLKSPPTLPLRPVIPNNTCPPRITAAAGTKLAGASFAGTFIPVMKTGFIPCRQWFTHRNASSHTWRCCVRVSPIAQNSLLLPPVGVWAVSQSQCGRTPSQAGYPSSPWWAVTPPTS